MVRKCFSTQWVIDYGLLMHAGMQCVSERDWRDKLKASEALKETIEKQRANLERVRREIGEKEMLCTTLKVRERERESMCQCAHVQKMRK